MLLACLTLFFILCFGLFHLPDTSAHLGGYHHNKNVVCYVGSWAYYRISKGSFKVQNIDPTLCTHLIYAFASLDETTNTIKVHDDNLDIAKKGYQDFVALKEKNPKLKVLIAIGGWNEGAEKYSWMANDKNNRTAFVRSVIDFIKLYKFDGLDLDWEYPGAKDRNGRPEDKQNFVELVRDLKEEFQNQGWLLTAALGAAPKTIKGGYDIPVLSNYLDLLNIMCYDYHGSWDPQTGHNAPLYPRPDESPDDKTFNLNSTIQLLLSLGVDRDKVAMGVPFYGRSFTLSNNLQLKPGSPSLKGQGMKGPYSNQSGFMGYNEFCEINLREKWTIERDSIQRVPYAHKDNTWFTFDDPISLQEKVNFALNQGLGGIMIWSIETDDFANVCQKGKFPLLRAVNEAIEQLENEIIDNKVVDTSTKKSGNKGSVKSTMPYLILFFLFSICFL